MVDQSSLTDHSETQNKLTASIVARGPLNGLDLLLLLLLFPALQDPLST
jgi:hypothetical protein